MEIRNVYGIPRQAFAIKKVEQLSPASSNPLRYFSLRAVRPMNDLYKFSIVSSKLLCSSSLGLNALCKNKKTDGNK